MPSRRHPYHAGGGVFLELSELTAYARERYGLEEQHKWADFPGFSVLSHPDTGKWVALLMRQWDSDTGVEIERCDIRCGGEVLRRLQKPYLSPAIRMHGNQWVNVAFGGQTESDIVFQLLDQAIAAGKPKGFTIVLGSKPADADGAYQETPLPFAGSSYRAEQEKLPERLRQMRRLYEYGSESAAARARNFYRQAMFMADYEDDAPWTDDFVCYFPTYHDLSVPQLRGYFSWRTRLRRGDVQPISASAAYLYVYELINGVGADSPEDSLQKLRDFARDFVDSGIGDRRMKPNLRRWMLDYAVLNGVDPSLARACADASMLAQDEALSVLKTPEAHTDGEVFAALCLLGGKKPEASPVVTENPERGKALFAQCWREASAYTWQDKNLFTLCFGEMVTRRWYPLTNAVYYRRDLPTDAVYALSGCRIYRCKAGLWTVESYEKAAFDKKRLQGFLHEADAKLRSYRKTGRSLRENAADAWASPYIDAVIAADREASRPRLRIDLSGLERIRRDAAETCESLLTEEETKEREETPALAPAESDLPLDAVQLAILRALLEGADAAPILRAQHRMPSIEADAINEAVFDEIGDSVLLCEGDALILVEDYIEDLRELLGGTHGRT